MQKMLRLFSILSVRLLAARSLLAIVGMSLFLSACVNQDAKKTSAKPPYNPNDGRYSQEKDSGPAEDLDFSHIPDAVPRHEVRTRAGNKNPYTVLGKTYHLIDDETDYRERGYASWYGNKFNGFHTSNGELYDMYAMTGAHKTLPIPSYVRVTNVNNGKSVVVRINDRGPFHPGRIVDLSYAAAQRIGINKTGTGFVDVEIALPGDVATNSKAPSGNSAAHKEAALPAGTYLQIAAFGNKEAAQQMAESIRKQLTHPVTVHSTNGAKQVHRVRLGPFKDAKVLQDARDQLARINIHQAHVVYQ